MKIQRSTILASPAEERVGDKLENHRKDEMNFNPAIEIGVTINIT